MLGSFPLGTTLLRARRKKKKEDEDEVFIIQEYLCIMLVSFIVDVHGNPYLFVVVCAQEVILRYDDEPHL